MLYLYFIKQTQTAARHKNKHTMIAGHEYLPLYNPYAAYEQLYVSQENPIFIPKKRHWADQRRAAKKRRRAK